MIPSQLGPVAHWLAEYGRSVKADAEVLTIADDEVTLAIRHDGDRWTVHKTWRDEDRGISFAGASAEDVDRYLTLISANEIRRRLGLPPLRHGITTGPDGMAIPRAGFSLSGDLDRGFTLTEGSSGREWRFASDIEASRFSLYADVPVERLRSAIVSPGNDLRLTTAP